MGKNKQSIILTISALSLAMSGTVFAEQFSCATMETVDADLAGKTVYEEGYVAADCREKSFVGATLVGGDGKAGAMLSGELIEGGNTYGLATNFQGADFSGVNFEGADFSDPNFEDWVHSTFISTVSKYSDENFNGIIYSPVLRDGNYKNINLNGAAFSGVDISGSDFDGVNFSVVKDAMISGLLAVNSKLRGADFTGVDLSFSNFDGADLTGAVFSDGAGTNATFNFVNFWGANLTNATFGKATVPGEMLSCANISGADFSEVEFEFDEGADETIYAVNCSEAKMPEGSYCPEGEHLDSLKSGCEFKSGTD